MKQRLDQMSQKNQLTNSDKYKAIATFIDYYVEIRHNGDINIRLSLLNGGITRIKPSVDFTLFPVEMN